LGSERIHYRGEGKGEAAIPGKKKMKISFSGHTEKKGKEKKRVGPTLRKKEKFTTSRCWGGKRRERKLPLVYKEGGGEYNFSREGVIVKNVRSILQKELTTPKKMKRKTFEKTSPAE